MRLTAIVMLILAVAMGATSVYLARDWLERQSKVASAVEDSMEITKIVVAKRPLNFGDVLTAEYLTETDWPAAMVPPESFGSIEELVGADGTNDRRVVLRAIQINEPVLASKLSGAGGKATLSTILETDMRAVTIRVNDVNGVAGFVLPGDRVDILLTRDEGKGGRSKNPITDILLQNVKVLGIDQKANDNEDKPKVARAVTFEVEPFDAQKLALAVTVGSLSLALRSQTNVDTEYARTVRVSDLNSRIPVKVETKPVSLEATKGPAAPVKKPRRTVYVQPANPFANVTVVRGVDSSTSKVLKDKEKALRKASQTATANSSIPAAKAPATGETTPKGPKIIVPEG